MWKQWRTCRFWFRYNRFVEKGMVVAVLADYPNYEYYLRKLTTDWELIEQNCSDSWSGISDHGSRIIRGLYYDRVQSKHIFIPTDSSENCRVLFCHDLFHLCRIRRRLNYCSGRVASWHSLVFRYTYSSNKRIVIIKATPWLLLYYPLAKRWVCSIRNNCPSVR
jgi:hypothetical protein